MTENKISKTLKLIPGSPLRIIFKIVFIIFFVELILMYFFHLISMPSNVAIIVDSVLLTITLAPVLYVTVYQPLADEILLRKQVESELLESRDNLEKRVSERTAKLAEVNAELQKAFDDVRTLTGLIPICANCKKVRDDLGYWNQIESYISVRSDAQFTHSICQECAKKLYPDDVDEDGNILKF